MQVAGLALGPWTSTASKLTGGEEKRAHELKNTNN